MKTYWFTIAAGDEYIKLYNNLKHTAEKNGIAIQNYSSVKSDKSAYRFEEQGSVKLDKIKGILNAPDGYDRIVFIDADTLINNVDGIDYQNGALKEPWGMGKVPFVVDDGGLVKRKLREQKLWRLLRKQGMSDFCPGGPLFRQEWNSGVIVGDRIFLEELCQEWLKWWELILDVNGGVFRRDQMSFKYAYKKIAIDKYGYDSLDVRYNWIVKRLGYQDDVCIYHKAGLYDQDQAADWAKVEEKLL